MSTALHKLLLLPIMGFYLIYTPLSCAENLGDHMYKYYYPGGTQPFRILYSSGSIGSFDPHKLTNVSGALVPVLTEEDLSDFSKGTYLDWSWPLSIDGSCSNGKCPQRNVVVLASNLVNGATFSTLQTASLYVVGVIIVPKKRGATPVLNYGSTKPFGEGSPESTLTPNSDYEWNPEGDSLSTASIPFPVFYVYGSFAQDVLVEAVKNVPTNHSIGVLDRYRVPADQARVAELREYLGPRDATSKLCLEIGAVTNQNIFATSDSATKCQPLGGLSVWAKLGKKPDKKWILATTALDSRNFVPAHAHVAADQTVSSLVAFLAAAEAIGKLDRSLWENEIVFAAFQAERFGYLGSRKFVDDVSGGSPCEIRQANNTKSATPTFDSWCLQPFRYSLAYENLDLKDLAHVIALDGVGGGKKSQFYVHSLDSGVSNTLVDDMTSTPQQNKFLASRGVKVSAATVADNIPPSPLNSFVKKVDSLSAAVLTGYDKEFTNKYYMSPLDDIDNINSTKVLEAATVLAQTLVKTASSDATIEVSVSPTLVNELLDCFLSNSSCSLFSHYRFIPNTTSTCYAKTFLKKPYGYNGAYTLYPGPFYQPFYSFTTPPGSLGEPGEAYNVINWKWMTNDRKWVQRGDSFEREDMSNDRMVLSPSWAENFVFVMLADFFKTPNATHESVGGQKNSTNCRSARDCANGPDISCVAGQCVSSQVYFHDAVSTGIKANDIEKYEIVDPSLPIYVEPLWGYSSWWSKMSIRFYTQGNFAADVIFFGLGLTITIVCAVVTKLYLPRFMVKNKMI